LARSQANAQDAAEAAKQDEAMLTKLGHKVDAVSLLGYFKQRTFADPDPKELERLVEQLGHDDFAVREKAHAKLLTMGTMALSGIKQGETNPDQEVRLRTADLRAKIESTNDPRTQSAMIRLIAFKKPAGAAETLLNFLPFTADASVLEEISRSLSVLAIEKNKASVLLLDCLGDKHLIKRAIALEVLAGTKNKEYADTFRKNLKDPAPEIRFRAGLGLIELREKEGLPVLVESLKHLGPDQSWKVEDVLLRLAGEEAPSVSLGADNASKNACHDAWNKWFVAHSDKLDLKKLDEARPMLGKTLIVQMGNRIVGGRPVAFNQGMVYELDRQKKELWKFNSTHYPVAAQVLGENKVLVAEFTAGRITEYTFKGEAKWTHPCGGNPLGVERLANGHTFFYTPNRIVEIDRNNKEVFTFNRPNNDIFRAKILKNQDVVFITNTGMVTRMNRQQKVLKSFQVPPISRQFGNFDVLPNGNILVPAYQNSKVTEFDGDGRTVRSWNFQLPSGVQALPNGNILVFSEQTRRVAELNRQGNEVMSHAADGQIFHASRR
jgi:hypothetical protein